MVQAFIDRIKEVDGHVNSFVHNRFEEAIAEAREIDRKIKEELDHGGPPNGTKSLLELPFLGVPFTGKDNIAVNGLYLTSGMYPRKGMRASYDADVVKNLKAAGAICLGITNCPEVLTCDQMISVDCLIRSSRFGGTPTIMCMAALTTRTTCRASRAEVPVETELVSATLAR